MNDFNEVKASAPVDIHLSELDNDSRVRTFYGWQDKALTLLLTCFTLFQLYSAISGTIPAQLLRMSHLAFVIPLVYWTYPAFKKSRRDKLPLVDFLLGLLFLGIALYYIFSFKALLARVGEYTQTDIILGAIGLLLILEACRRAVGVPLVVISSVFILYAYFGKVMPGFLHHR